MGVAMSENLFWLSETQMERLRPLLPDKVRGVPRTDDRRVISGIIHILKSGCRWIDAPAEYGPRKTLYNRWRRWAGKGSDHAFDGCASSRPWPTRAAARAGAHRQLRRLGPPLGQRGKRGEVAQGIGRSRGGRTTKVHALADRWCRPVRLMPTGGNVATALLPRRCSSTCRRTRSWSSAPFGTSLCDALPGNGQGLRQ